MDIPYPDYQQLMRMWMEFASKMANAGMGAASEPVFGNAAKQMRDAYLQTLSQFTDQYMRSPQFLEMVRQSTDSAVAMRKQTNDALAEMHHATGGLARPDADALLMAMRRCESRVLDRLDELSDKVADMEDRLAAAKAAGRRASRKSR